MPKFLTDLHIEHYVLYSLGWSLRSLREAYENGGLLVLLGELALIGLGGYIGAVIAWRFAKWTWDQFLELCVRAMERGTAGLIFAARWLAKSLGALASGAAGLVWDMLCTLVLCLSAPVLNFALSGNHALRARMASLRERQRIRLRKASDVTRPSGQVVELRGDHDASDAHIVSPNDDAYRRALEVLKLTGKTKITRQMLREAGSAALSRAHPDKGGSPEDARALAEALAVIKERHSWA